MKRLVIAVSFSFLATAVLHGQIRKRTGSDVGTDQRAASQAAAEQQAEQKNVAFKEQADSVAKQYPANCDVAEQKATTNIRFYPPFAPNDSVADGWCKIQFLVTTEPIKVSLVSSEATSQLFSIRPPKPANKDEFMYNLALTILQDSNADLWRATRTIGSLGVPESAPESAYQWYDARLQMEVGGLDIQGMRFTVTLLFNANRGLVPQHLMKAADYLHLKMSYYDASRRQITKEVGFPWVLESVSLTTTDKKLDLVGAELKKQILTKYAQYVKQKDVAAPDSTDKTHVVTRADDGSVVINIHEGATPQSHSKYVQIVYVTKGQGPLDIFVPGTAALKKYVADLTDREKKKALGGLSKNPF
jgi:hypothetical protein